MSVDVASALKDDVLPAAGISGEAAAEFLIPGGSSPCTNCSFNREYYVALSERGYWKGQHRKAREKIEELAKEVKELRAKLRFREKQLFGKKSEKKSGGSEKRADLR